MLLRKAGLNEVIVKRSITVKPTTTLLEARDILFKHKIRRLIVLGAKDKPVGIITEKDVAKTVYSLGGKSIKLVKVGDFMSKNLVTVKKNATVYDCAKLMSNRKISSIIVLNEKGALDGLVTKTDLVSVFLTQATKPLKVSDIMIRHDISGLPVVRKSSLVGIITKSDIVNAIAKR